MADRDWKLFDMVHPKVTPSWAAIAEAVRRDPKVTFRAYLVRKEEFADHHRSATER